MFVFLSPLVFFAFFLWILLSWTTCSSSPHSTPTLTHLPTTCIFTMLTTTPCEGFTWTRMWWRAKCASCGQDGTARSLANENYIFQTRHLPAGRMWMYLRPNEDPASLCRFDDHAEGLCGEFACSPSVLQSGVNLALELNCREKRHIRRKTLELYECN